MDAGEKKEKKERAKPRPMAIDPDSPWLQVKTDGAAYAKRSPRFLMREIKAGRLRAAKVGGRGEYVTTRPWIDAWFEDLATPVVVNVRRRA